MSSDRVLVIGTTTDYVDLLQQRHPGRAVFLTDRALRSRAAEPAPAEDAEVLCDLGEPDDAVRDLLAHLDRHALRPLGVACFDDESMALASRVAAACALPYPSAEAVAACRSKFASKQRWQRAGLPCPRSRIVCRAEEAVAFRQRLGQPIVLKPLTGSGSELTFRCTGDADCAEAFVLLRAGLLEHPEERMYAPQTVDGASLNPREAYVAEEWVQGRELSCDFLVEDGVATVLRTASKIAAPDLGFGTTLAYVVPAVLPAGIELPALERQLGAAARALGIERALCMIDLVVRDGEALMLEMAPRPGGDCLPPLLWRSSGLDILGATLDAAEGRTVRAPTPSQWRTLVGLRLFAAEPGTIERLDISTINEDSRVIECHLKREPGHRVVFPPDDYESRLLGHVIFDPGRDDPEPACRELAGRLTVRMEPSA